MLCAGDIRELQNTWEPSRVNDFCYIFLIWKGSTEAIHMRWNWCVSLGGTYEVFSSYTLTNFGRCDGQIE